MSTRKTRVWWVALVVAGALLAGALAIFFMVGFDEAPEVSVEDSGRSALILSGRVVDGESRAALPGVAVALEGAAGPTEVLTDQEGFFRFGPWPEGSAWRLALRADRRCGHLTAEAAERAAVGRGVEVEAWRLARVRGRVLHRGDGVEGAQLEVVREDGRGCGVVKVQTGARGLFEIATPPGRVSLSVSAAGLPEGGSGPLTLEGGETLGDVVVDLTRRGSVHLQVRRDDGRGIPGAFVVSVGEPSGRAPVRTDSRGVAELEGLAEGPVLLKVWTPRYEEAHVEARVAAGRQARIETVLSALKGIVGVVETLDGRPARGAVVALRPEGLEGNVDSRQTGRGGVFHFGKLERGRYEVWASHPRHGSTQVMVAEPREGDPIRLVLPKGGSISGSVVDPGGDQVESFTVVVERFVASGTVGAVEAGPLGPRHFRPESFSQGGFVLEDLAPGTYDLLVDAPGWSPGTVEGVVLVEGRAVRGVLVRLEAGASVTGLALDDADGEALEGVRIRVWDSARRRLRLPALETSSDAQGRFTIEGLAPGRRSVRLTREGYATRDVPGIELTSRRETAVEVRLSALRRGEVPRVEFSGIGASLKTTPSGGVAIGRFIEGSLAEAAGLKVGDEILRVDGQSTQEVGMMRTVELIRGHLGEPVLLEIKRDAEPFPFEVRIERGLVRYRDNAHKKGGAKTETK